MESFVRLPAVRGLARGLLLLPRTKEKTHECESSRFAHCVCARNGVGGSSKSRCSSTPCATSATRDSRYFRNPQRPNHRGGLRAPGRSTGHPVRRWCCGKSASGSRHARAGGCCPRKPRSGQRNAARDRRASQPHRAEPHSQRPDICGRIARSWSCVCGWSSAATTATRTTGQAGSRRAATARSVKTSGTESV